MRASDGRLLDVLVGGAASNRALVLHHGTPSDATLWNAWSDACSAQNLRLLAISRPGYGRSERRHGRSVASVATDVADVLDAYEIESFVSAGWSGGGPHALACAALLTPRCKAVATLAGVGPYGRPELDFLAGMGPENHAEFGAALEGEAAVAGWLEANQEPLRHVSGPGLAQAFGGLVDEVDRSELVGGFADELAETMRRALQGGYDGWVDDDLAFVRDWEFELSTIAVPVLLWQGDHDFMVPRTHAEWLAAHLPTAELSFVPGEGHITLVTRYRDRVVEALAARF